MTDFQSCRSETSEATEVPRSSAQGGPVWRASSRSADMDIGVGAVACQQQWADGGGVRVAAVVSGATVTDPSLSWIKLLVSSSGVTWDQLPALSSLLALTERLSLFTTAAAEAAATAGLSLSLLGESKLQGGGSDRRTESRLCVCFTGVVPMFRVLQFAL